MASRKSFLAKPSYIFLTTSDSDPNFNQTTVTDDVSELDEADIWNFTSNTNCAIESSVKKQTLLTSRSASKRASKKADGGGRVNPVPSASLPVNIPDWSKILKDDYEEHRRESDEDDECYNYEGIRIPPHEYLARTRGTSFSVHEGIGRTLKGRDLRRVRNAIWKKVGFED